jgi:hypothetical protein
MVDLAGGESRGISEAGRSERAGNAGSLEIFQGWTSETDAGWRVCVDLEVFSLEKGGN